MSDDRAPTPGGSGGELSQEPDELEPDELDEAREAELTRAVVRAQERHREGGVEPELADLGLDRNPEPEPKA
jgi:hypothetical protein